ncbi:aspartate carbamoyltransferase [Caldisalinibacter kiritimatiensis]|uniref:Aspartate carbamoyltransferase n=1 Tax=Caldisalinibacter kiritimatiensis TaxID=1304284 RepID=R1ARG6_9FIRM|nr:aspartate carbamoyltransferase [Caldisalinibacter kiritimatiensis]EOC99747.1 Aspartate carbamoyltransferase [Caldisalinibacter kiritimatiensis]
MNLKGKHLIDPNDFTLEELDQIFKVAQDMEKHPKKYSEICKSKILATLFYEPSTRTRLSFESAMLRMGGNILGFADATTSSVSKGESVADTVRVVSGYADIIVMRHPKEGAPLLSSEYSSVPVINGGDGGHQHPTQTLTDLLTIKNLKGKIDDNKVALCGDLKYGRTVHSLIKTLARYKNMSFYLVSPPQLKLPTYIKEFVKNEYNAEIFETSYLEEVINEVDILYMTRIQRERFFNEEDYLKLKNSYILTRDKIKDAKEDMLIMHPLPRVNEIDYSVDDDKRAVYFKQAQYGVYVRMSLMAHLLGVV